MLEDKLESAIEEALGSDTFQSIRGKVASELGYDKPGDAIKNVEGAARLVELIYDAGLRIPILEEIVQKVTELRMAD